MRKHAVILTLTLLQILALVLLTFFWLVMRPDLAVTYGLVVDGAARSAALPAATRLALTEWFAPVVGAGGAVLFALAWLVAPSARARDRLLGAALVWTVLGLAWAMWAAYAPAFERLPVVNSNSY